MPACPHTAACPRHIPLGASCLFLNEDRCDVLGPLRGISFADLGGPAKVGPDLRNRTVPTLERIAPYAAATLSHTPSLSIRELEHD